MNGTIAAKWIDENTEKLLEVNDLIWEYAETGYKEYKSVQLLQSTLRSHGFTIESEAAGIQTAFKASWGKGKPIIGFLGEYDALPNLSQKAVPYQEPLLENGPGHGCGHSLLGTGVLGAVLGLQQEMIQRGQSGTIVYYGCPAEETGEGKSFMARAGLFNELDAALTWHPYWFNGLCEFSFMSMLSVKYSFHGRAAHAAGNPELGRSALDAVELMNVGVNYLREHVIPDARIHYVITKGGTVPNVVPADAEVWYFMRAPKRDYVEELYGRIEKIAQGAALMTETELKIDILSGCYEYLPNHTLGKLLQECMERIGVPAWDEADMKFAENLATCFEPNQREDTVGVYKLAYKEDIRDMYLHTYIAPYYNNESLPAPGSTDVADVSWVVPTAQFLGSSYVIGVIEHSWQVTATGAMGIGHKSMLTAAKYLAAAGSELLCRPELLENAKKEFVKSTGNKPYKCLVPNEVKPPCDKV